MEGGGLAVWGLAGGGGDDDTTQYHHLKVCIELICNSRIGQTQRGTSKVACLWIWLFPIAFLVCLESDNPFNFSTLARTSAPGTRFWPGELGLVEKPSPSNGLLRDLTYQVLSRDLAPAQETKTSDMDTSALF